MTFDELREHLRAVTELQDLDAWTFTAIPGGHTSAHTYRLRSEGRDYFVKEVKDNERDALKLLAPLRLVHVAAVVYPNLLDRNILVAEYVGGGPLESKSLEPDLIIDLATIQNHLNGAEYIDEPARDQEFFFGRYATRCFEEGCANLLALGALRLPIVELCRHLTDLLAERRVQIAQEFSAMPFAWQHHDFREENILGRNPQKIVDWGSSYGRGPFLFDLAPFLLNAETRLQTFVAHSHVCRKADRSTIERWLYVAASVRLMELLRCVQALTDCGNREALASFLAYHYATYKSLLASADVHTR